MIFLCLISCSSVFVNQPASSNGILQLRLLKFHCANCCNLCCILRILPLEVSCFLVRLLEEVFLSIGGEPVTGCRYEH